MKKTLVVTLILLCPFLAANAMVAGVQASSGDGLRHMRLVIENDHLRLFINDSTTEVAVQRKMTGSTWRSNPADRDLDQGVAGETISIVYAPPGVEQAELSNDRNSIALGQFQISDLEDGVRIDYTIGDRYGNLETILPQLISQERFDSQVLPKIANSMDQKFIRDNYTLIMLEKTDRQMDEDVGGRQSRPWWRFWEKQQSQFDTTKIDAVEQALFGSYRLISLEEDQKKRAALMLELREQLDRLESSEGKGNTTEIERLKQKLAREVSAYERDRADLVWKLTEKFTGHVIGGGTSKTEGYRSDVKKMADLTQDDFAHMQDAAVYMLSRVPVFHRDDMEKIFKEIGYTISDLVYDHFQNRLDPPVPNVGIFEIPLEYRLDGDSLVVRLPMDEVEYPDQRPTKHKVNFNAASAEEGLVFNTEENLVTYPLQAINLLRYFGAAGADADGYIFVPDGSGALIHFSGDKTGVPVYSQPVYGPDWSLPRYEGLPYRPQLNHLPVFGLKNGNQALFAVIEEGEGIADIRADVIRGTNQHNVVFAGFNTSPKVTVQEEKAKVNVYQKRICRGSAQIRYFFLEGEEANYVGMASRYRQYLVDQLKLDRIRSDSIPFFMETIGVIPKLQPVMGVPRLVSVPVTSFGQAQQMTAELLENGVGNLKLRYTGWLQGGLEHLYPTKVRIDGVLGSRRELTDLRDYLDSRNVDFFPDVGFMNVYRNRLFDGFSPSRDAARFLNRLIAQKYEYDWVTLRADTTKSTHILSPRRLDRLIDGFFRDYRNYGIEGISLTMMGSQVNSDFREDPNRLIDRQQAVGIVERQLAKLSGEYGLKVLVTGGNAYVLPYARDIIGMPTASTEYGLADEAVPFYQIVAHGLFNYAGPPINLAADVRKAMLKTIETGAGVYFKWLYAEPSILKGTEFDYLYDVNYGDWRERALQFYAEANAALAGVQGELIVGHEQLQEGVYRTTYSNGTAIVVNYGEASVQIDGITVAGQSYRVVEGGSINEEKEMGQDFTSY
ncbi:MAG: hypothetical protein GX977_00055 [Firmicutes bacterium]|nr:hypothetical protein [Bacillota bacterium]